MALALKTSSLVDPTLDSTRLPQSVGSEATQSSTQTTVATILSSGPDIRKRLIRDFEDSLLMVGSCEDHRKKIETLLQLIDICTEATHGEDIGRVRETYFYHAVSIGRRYLGDALWTDPLGNQLSSAYFIYIEPGIDPVYIEDKKFKRGRHSEIELESTNRRSVLLAEARDTKKYLDGITDYSRMIDKIEEALGLPVRLLMISEKSGEVLTAHRMDSQDIENIRRSSQKSGYPLEVEISGEKWKYRIIIDHGTIEPLNQIDSGDIKTIINPILSHYIQQKEYAVISFASDYRDITRKAEERMEIPSQSRDYNSFITSILSKASPVSIPIHAREDPEYMRECLQAIDISRILTLRQDPSKFSLSDTIESIDSILGGKITRRVLDMARAILISQAEMMNGSGYPSGLLKNDIPLEARIYSIIRAYEALCKKEKDIEEVYARLCEWNQGGYFDADIFALFMKFLAKGGSSSHPLVRENTGPRVTAHREKYYRDFIDDYGELRELIDRIEHTYTQFHGAGDDTKERSRLVILSNGLRSRLIQQAKFSKIFFVTGHGQTLSDTIDGQPGGEEEGLTPDGIKTSKIKRKVLDDLSLTMYSSPLTRAEETAGIIYGTRRKSSLKGFCIIPVEGLRNPRKDHADRGEDLLEKMLIDDPRPILNFVRWMARSSQDSEVLTIAHRTTNVYVKGMLENLGKKEKILLDNIPIGEESIIAYLIRGGRQVEWDILFPFPDWRGVLREVDMICKTVFGEPFFLRKYDKIHLIHLHKRFLDYIDSKMEECPEKVEDFLMALDAGNTTKHFREVLRNSDLANKKLLYN